MVSCSWILIRVTPAGEIWFSTGDSEDGNDKLEPPLVKVSRLVNHRQTRRTQWSHQQDKLTPQLAKPKTNCSNFTPWLTLPPPPAPSQMISSPHHRYLATRRTWRSRLTPSSCTLGWTGHTELRSCGLHWERTLSVHSQRSRCGFDRPLNHWSRTGSLGKRRPQEAGFSSWDGQWTTAVWRHCSYLSAWS